MDELVCSFFWKTLVKNVLKNKKKNYVARKTNLCPLYKPKNSIDFHEIFPKFVIQLALRLLLHLFKIRHRERGSNIYMAKIQVWLKLLFGLLYKMVPIFQSLQMSLSKFDQNRTKDMRNRNIFQHFPFICIGFMGNGREVQLKWKIGSLIFYGVL